MLYLSRRIYHLMVTLPSMTHRLPISTMQKWSRLIRSLEKKLQLCKKKIGMWNIDQNGHWEHSNRCVSASIPITDFLRILSTSGSAIGREMQTTAAGRKMVRDSRGSKSKVIRASDYIFPPKSFGPESVYMMLMCQKKQLL